MVVSMGQVTSSVTAAAPEKQIQVLMNGQQRWLPDTTRAIQVAVFLMRTKNAS
jgi:hypothetical protein